MWSKFPDAYLILFKEDNKNKPIFFAKRYIYIFNLLPFRCNQQHSYKYDHNLNIATSKYFFQSLLLEIWFWASSHVMLFNEHSATIIKV